MSSKTELLAAIEDQNPTAVFRALRTGQFDFQSDEFRVDNPLFKAVEIGNASIVRLLVESGASYKSTDENYHEGVTAFDLAVNFGQEAVVDYFLTLEPTQAEIVQTLDGVTRSQHIFDALVSRITDINGRFGNDNRTPLMAVADSTNLLEDAQVGKDRVQRLLDLGANKELVDNKGRRAYDYANNPSIKLLLKPASGTPGPAAFTFSGAAASQPQGQTDKLGCILGGACFFMPLIGLILYLVWNRKYPGKAKTALICALVGIGVVLLLQLLA